MFGYYRICAATPRVTVADCAANAREIREIWRQAAEKNAAAVILPELSLTGCSCGDLFLQEQLLTSAEEHAAALVRETSGSQTLLIFGMPLRRGDRLYNCAVAAGNGAILGIVPQSFPEERYFAGNAPGQTEILWEGLPVPFGTDLIFRAGRDFSFALEIGTDGDSLLAPGSRTLLAGARAVFCLTSAMASAGGAEERRIAAQYRSKTGKCIFAAASAGGTESTTDGVYCGHSLIAGNGALLQEGSVIYADADFRRIGTERRMDRLFQKQSTPGNFREIALNAVPESPDWHFARLSALPFVPEDPEKRRLRCEEIFSIQCAGLAKRVAHTHAGKLVLGISGGLDSTLALLVAAECCRMLGRSASDILTITMPGFGTTGRTYQNAVAMCRKLGTELREISIQDACLQHFADIGHDPAILDVTYENVQARERTQILMDLANQCGGLVIGTGDLSEIALGWSTYNGDHMSMYAVNCDVPKTLIRFLIAHAADQSDDEELASILRDVIDTPVSPELLPADASGKIQQKTEELVGPYELHDFFLWHFVRYGAEPEKIAALAEHVFAGTYSAEVIRRWLKRFLQRFFQQQFKRSCAPDGPRVGTIALSPRGAWQMPSDASGSGWLQTL